jgi:hypothetical protein
LLLLVLALCWLVVCLGVGVVLILGMRQQYYREVYMISFLNSEMILRSKRVESFLYSLSKSSS